MRWDDDLNARLVVARFRGDMEKKCKKAVGGDVKERTKVRK
jgi:hypothetical protein